MCFPLFQNAAAPSPLGQMPPQDGMPGGPMPGGPGGFFPVSFTQLVQMSAPYLPAIYSYKEQFRALMRVVMVTV